MATEKYFKHLMIEPTNVCNLHCPVCPTGDKSDKRPKGFMAFRQFKNIIDLTKGFIESINLWGFGEPFLVPDIMKMIDYAGKNNIITTVHTNGTVLDKKMMDQFKKNYKINISFSIDGITQRSYSYYRRGGSLKKVLNNLSYLTNLKRKNNLHNLNIVWQFLIMRTNENEIPEVIKLAKKIGVDRLNLKTISISKKNLQYNNFIPKNRDYQRLKNKIVNFGECSFINPGRPTISYKGEVVPCCQDLYWQNIMGNAFRKNLLDIWNSPKYQTFREKYKKNLNNFCNKRCHINKMSLIYVKEINFNQ